MVINIGIIKNWSDQEISPFAWQRILFRLLPDFQKEGLFLHLVKEETVVSKPLLDKIGQAYIDVYNKSPLTALQ